MKKIILILMIPLATFAITSKRAQTLNNEFRRVGIYNPTRPSNYNENRARLILQELRKGFRGMAKELELAQAKSLQHRTRAPAPPRDDAELERLRQENAQLRRQNQEILNISRNIATGHNNARAFTAGAGASLQHTPPDIPGALNNIREALERIRQMGDLYDQLGTYLNP